MGQSVTVIALPLPRDVGAFGAMVVLHVAGAALGRELAGLDMAAPFELGEDRLVWPAHGVRQHVEPPAVRHADHHLAGARIGGALDGEIEHRHQHVHALDREALVAEIRLVEEPLERLHLGEPLEQPLLVGGGHRLPIGAAFDLLAEPDALFVRGDVLDLVRHRAAVGGLKVRQRFGQRAPGYRDPQHLRRDGSHHLGGEAERAGVEGGVADGGRAERDRGAQPGGRACGTP